MFKRHIVFTIIAIAVLIGLNFALNGASLRSKTAERANAVTQALEKYTPIYAAREGLELKLSTTKDLPHPPIPSLARFIGYAQISDTLKLGNSTFPLKPGSYSQPNGTVTISQASFDINPSHVGCFWTSYKESPVILVDFQPS